MSSACSVHAHTTKGRNELGLVDHQAGAELCVCVCVRVCVRTYLVAGDLPVLVLGAPAPRTTSDLLHHACVTHTRTHTHTQYVTTSTHVMTRANIGWKWRHVATLDRPTRRHRQVDRLTGDEVKKKVQGGQGGFELGLSCSIREASSDILSSEWKITRRMFRFRPCVHTPKHEQLYTHTQRRVRRRRCRGTPPFHTHTHVTHTRVAHMGYTPCRWRHWRPARRSPCPPR